ncbi:MULTISPECIES: LysR family transcriptional regulator [unclassified Janthinobacterium]|uniref:LysR family transcriptional regulator n=1 Tax=unclassified Janthinobacterium TaxID=2610881 RepID=UPI00160A65B9|nr:MULTISPECIES: LysR family transcriptional regulator [unclassified Janthinobacterium]MBB5366792.1 DNA-binding transcriptional LysR family regulator [Janthinobacterium sp. K2C7]MBB5380730.1 DNA-binding transcriptional LysR family regulator [Janthinobacterium sp. K2Li3]MBB5385174.1 DNA-binding transcriptional LysR family regulator [Janthinobacterium sp. K2E3]
MDINSDDLKIFVTVIDSGTLSAAAVHLGQTTSGVSRALSRLEDKLATSLLTRTTRRMELTEEGQLFLERARTILDAMEEVEESIRIRHQKPAGRLCVDAASPFMLHCVVPHVAEFRAMYPDIRLELSSNDQIADLLEHRTDIAIRIGALSDSTLHARALSSSPLHVLATPAYLARHGEPRTPEELAGHALLGFAQYELGNNWPLRHATGNSLQIVPALAASSGETLRQLALNDQGIVCLSDFMTKHDIAAGRLVRILQPFYTGYRQQIHAVYYRNTQLSQRISCFLEFLQQKL